MINFYFELWGTFHLIWNYKSHKSKRLIKGSLLVTKNKPLLNGQVKPMKLELIWFNCNYLLNNIIKSVNMLQAAILDNGKGSRKLVMKIYHVENNLFYVKNIIFKITHVTQIILNDFN